MRELIEAFKSLSDETRLRILNLISERECCVCEVMRVLDISQTRASRNLGILRDAGFLKMRKDGLWSYYAINDQGTKESPIALVKYIKSALAGNAQAAIDLDHLRKSVRVGPGCKCIPG